jgi:hypothetical protein
MGWGDFQSSAGVTVNIDNALGVPAVWAAVNFISGTLASLPLEVYRGNERVTDGVGAWLNRAINPTPSVGLIKMGAALLDVSAAPTGLQGQRHDHHLSLIQTSLPINVDVEASSPSLLTSVCV